MNRAVFLDRDGTINKDSGYVNRPSDVKLLKNATTGLRNIQNQGLLTIVVSNQSGVGRGYLTLQTLDDITRRLEELLEKEEVKLTDIFYAPYYSESKYPEFRVGVEDRKPNTGMIEKAVEKYDIDLASSYMIGDMETDIVLGNRAGLITILVLTGKGKRTLRWLKKNREYRVHYIARDLLDASHWIANQEKERFGVARKIKSWIEVKQAVVVRSNRKIVFTNGCFDILHYGHIKYLEEASRLGDVFIIGLNSDESVRRLKGEERPILDESTRAIKLAALEFVDFVVLFEQDTPKELIDYIKPDILVKGGDYKKKDVVGADIVERYGGIVKIIPFIENYSTTNIIEKIRGSSV